MDETQLIKIGLNINESKVYLKLLNKGVATAGELIKDTEFHRNIVYDNLEKLIDKGLVSYILEGKIKVFQANPPENISEMLEKEQTKLNEKKKIAEDVKKSISRLISNKEQKQEVTVFRGVEGIKFLLNNTLEYGKDYIVFGAPKISVEIMGDYYWENYNLKAKEKKIKLKMIFNEELREWSKVIKNPLTKIKFLSKKFDTLTETIVYGDKVVIIVWSNKPIATLIKDSNLASSYGQYFNILWKQAKK